MRCMPHGQVGGLLSGALLRALGQPGFFEGQDQKFDSAAEGRVEEQRQQQQQQQQHRVLLVMRQRLHRTSKDCSTCPYARVRILHTYIVFFTHVHLYAHMGENNGP